MKCTPCCVQVIERSINTQARLPTDPNAEAFGMKVDSQMLTVSSAFLYTCGRIYIDVLDILLDV